MKHILPAILSLVILSLYGSSATAGELVSNGSDVRGQAWIVAVSTPHLGIELRGVRERVLTMLSDEGISAITADRIITCESMWNPNAINHNRNGSNDMGLWQLNSVHGLSDEVRLDPIKSTEFAITLIKKQGFKPWVCSK